MKNKFCIIKTTFSVKQDAIDMARLLLESKLIACAQIEEIESLYSWKGELNHEREFSLSLKTASNFYKKIEKLICDNHPYDVPQIIQIHVQNGYKIYLKWVLSNLDESHHSEIYDGFLET